VLLAADNLHGLNQVVMESLNKLDPKPLQQLARQCRDAGADVLDLNPGYLPKRKHDRMAFMVETIQECVPLRLMLDSPNPDIIAEGIKHCAHPPIINGLSLDPYRVEKLPGLAREYGSELVILLMDERSFTPPTLDEKAGLALELRQACLNAGLDQSDLIFDPVLPNLSWDDAHLRVVESIKFIRLTTSGALFQEPARTMTGVSNLRSGQSRFQSKIEAAYFGLLAGAGLNIALTNLLDTGLAENARLIKGLVE
jgi:5-methyltetrahydrofolate corrinoid/iron sulfur protein methyltransferase